MIDLSWVSDYIDISSEDVHLLAEKIKTAGINIEQVITNHIDGVVVGEVLECKPHPDSDHLHVCKVNVGSEVLQIVCGAPNVKSGLKVIVATVGAILPDDFVIKKTTIRGVESSGMICALYELGLEEKTEEAYNRGIHELDSNAPVGVDAIKYLGLDSTMYELDIHKHRNNDCYYHIGFAYEIAAILNKKVTLPDTSYNETSLNIKDNFNLKVETLKCPFYLAKVVRNVNIKESPDFIKRRLINAGMRPINNVVDISNYVMLEFGQPMHFFDKDKLGNNVLVRDAKDGEEITTLDGKKRVLNSKDIVITDGSDAVAIAGVMGGITTEVVDDTKNILIEAAIFDPVSIRNTSKRLNLPSEASIRYGKGLNYEYTILAMNRACHLLQKYADAEVLSGEVLIDKIDKTPKKVEFSANDVNKILGITITTSDMEKELNRLEFFYTLNKDLFTVTIPNRRLDIDPNVNDIAEEIGRLYGYHNLVSTLPKVDSKRGRYLGDNFLRKKISMRLRNLGLNEVKTYTLVSPTVASGFRYEEKEQVVLPNPMSIDKSVVRTTLIPSLINVYNYNKARKLDDILIYEISKTYDKNYNEDIKIAGLMKGNYFDSLYQKTNVKIDFYIIKGVVENILDYLGFNNRYSFISDILPDMHPFVGARIMLDKDNIGVIGKVHPKVTQDDVYVFEISLNSLMRKSSKLKYQKVTSYPDIQKDASFIVSIDTQALDIIKTIRKSGGRYLNSIKIFDIYMGDKIDSDKKSIAFNFKFSSNERTLTDKEVMEAFSNIIKNVCEKNNAILRDK